jgi:hypothetical protein
MPEVMVVRVDRELVKLTVDGVEYEYDTSYYHAEKFKGIFRRSPLKALNHIKKNSYSEKKTGRVIDWNV